jgi:cytochrome c
MDSFEMSKVGGAVLAAMLLMLAPTTIGNLFNSGHDTAGGGHAVMGGYNLPIPEVKAEAPASDAKAVAAFDPTAVVKMIAAGKPENGEATFKKCASCHAISKGAKSGVGPSLWGLVGRKMGSQADYAGYSEAIKAKGSEWSLADLAAFLHNPKGWMPGTKMAIAVADPAELADLLAYLRGLSDAPVALP